MGKKGYLTVLAMTLVFLGLKFISPVQSELEAFWDRKVDYHDVYDVILLGDSQTAMNLNPSLFATQLNKTVFNLGFYDNNYTRKYLASADRYLKKKKGAKVIFNLTMTMLKRNLQSKNFDKYYQKFHKKNIFKSFFEGVDIQNYFNLQDFLDGIKKDYSKDGQVKVFTDKKYVLDPKLKTINETDDLTPVINNLTEMIAKWKSQGVEVYFFTLYMEAERDLKVPKLPKFMIRKLERAGAKYLRVKSWDYKTYDGIHLNHVEADKLSRNLAHLIFNLKG